MAREPHIPLFLWIAAAILAHLTWGGGADRVAAVIEAKTDVRRFAASVERQLRGRFRVEVALLDPTEIEVPDALPPDVSDAAEAKPDTADAEALDDTRVDPAAALPVERQRKPPDARPDEVPPPEPDREKPEAAKPEKKKLAKEEEEPERKPESRPLPEPARDPRRIAVVQEVEKPDQEPNPTAEFLSEQANRVDQQTQARITATDQNNPDPSPGSQHHGPVEAPGNSHVTDVAHSDDSPGEISKAPSEDQLAGERSEVSVSQTPGVPEVAGRVREGPEQDDPGERGQSEMVASRSRSAMPETLGTASGAWSMAREREARREQAARQARRRRLARASGQKRGASDFLGLGANGLTERGINLNLTHGTAMAAVGRDALARDIRADGERRRSQHRGSWKRVGIERWRPAIENYVSTVRLGNTTALNTAASPFASYLNRIHNRLHPIFAVDYLGFLNDLPASVGLSDMGMKTDLEIVLNRSNGSLVKMGVTRTSGHTVFDISVLEAVNRAAPFGTPPASIVSPDGNVYLHWEFHRNPLYACSTYFARPYIIKAPQKTAPPNRESPGPFSPEEAAPRRQGHWLSPAPERRQGHRHPHGPSGHAHARLSPPAWWLSASPGR